MGDKPEARYTLFGRVIDILKNAYNKEVFSLGGSKAMTIPKEIVNYLELKKDAKLRIYFVKEKSELIELLNQTPLLQTELMIVEFSKPDSNGQKVAPTRQDSLKVVQVVEK